MKKEDIVKIRLECELNKLKAEIVVKKKSSIKNYDELMEILKCTDKKDQTQCIYLNRLPIQNILLEEDKMINISNENINYNGNKSLFYLALSINSDKYVLNYSYDFDFVNDLLDKIKREEIGIKKLILYILLDIIYENYKQLSNTTESNDNDQKEKTSEEIKAFINQNLSLLNEFDIFLKPNKNEEIDIEIIYNQIIISLIRQKKFDNCEYDTKKLLELLDIENIELTNKMYESIKKEFDENLSREYLDSYKIKNAEDLDNEKILNFYYILLKYLFKKSIYLYNIQFLLDSQNSVKKIIRSNYFIIEQLLKNNLNSIEEKKYFVLTRLLDSEYYISKKDLNKLFNDKLKEILDYYQNFHQNQMNKIKEIKEIMKKQDQNKAEKFMSEYDEAKRKNKRLKFYKYIYELQLTKSKKIEDFNKVVSILDKNEQSIHEKKTNLQKMKLRDEIFNFFSDEKNKDYSKEIFEQNEIDLFIKIYNIYYIVKLYFKNYYFESKKKDIEKIELTIENKEKYELEEYLQYLDEAKKKNYLYLLISKLYPIDNKTKTEAYIESKMKDWENLKNLIEEEKYDKVDDEAKIKLYIFFNNEKNKESHEEILDEEKYNFLVEKKAEVEEIIINYYKKFYPESKKDVIEKKKFEDNDYELYLKLKKIRLREPLIFSLFGEKRDLKEKEFSEAKEKWEKIERDINDRYYNNINENDRRKIIKFFENKDNEENKFIKEIFTEEIIESFIKQGNLKNKEKFSGKSTFNRGGKYKKRQQMKKEKFEINNEKKDQVSCDFSTKSQTDRNGLSFQDQSEYLIKEESNEKVEDIIKNNFRITMTLKNKSIEDNDILIDELGYGTNYLNKLKQQFSDYPDSYEYKIFNILDKLKEQLIEQFTNNFKLVIELIFERLNLYNTDFSLKYKVWLINSILNKDGSFFSMENKVSNILSDDNIVHNAFENLLNEINEPKYKKICKKEENNLKIKTKEINNQQVSSNSQTNQGNIISETIVPNANLNNNMVLNQITEIPTYNEDPTPYKIPFAIDDSQLKEKEENNQYRIFSSVRVIGSHFEYRRNNTAEFVKELKSSGKYISVGSDKKAMNLYDSFGCEIKEVEIPEIRDHIYDFFERGKIKDEFYYFACANKEIYTLKQSKKSIIEIDKNWELPNMTCISSLPIVIKEKVKSVSKNNKKKKNNSRIEYKEIENTYDLVVVAGRNGVICLVNIFEEKKKEFDSFNIISGGAYRGLHKFTDTRIAITSNSIIPEGMNKLIIYNFALNNKNTSDNKNKKGGIEFETNENDENERYSFVASNTGMATINDNVLLCACKKYTEKDKNGILMLTIINENKQDKLNKIFLETGEFEVHCFCPLKADKLQINILNINDFEDHFTKNDIFLVGGFDSKLGEGRIKLYTLVRKGEEIKGVKFLQDVELPKTKEMDIESRIEKKKKMKIKVFNGAISSLIQSSIDDRIFVSCYDGRVYLLSKPNLDKYNNKQKKN